MRPDRTLGTAAFGVELSRHRVVLREKINLSNLAALPV